MTEVTYTGPTREHIIDAFLYEANRQRRHAGDSHRAIEEQLDAKEAADLALAAKNHAQAALALVQAAVTLTKPPYQGARR